MAGTSNPVTNFVGSTLMGPAGQIFSFGKSAKETMVDKPMREANHAAKVQTAQMNDFMKQMTDRKKTEEETAAGIAAREEARARQRAMAGGGSSYRPSILTGPLGLMNDPGGARKTLLGT